MQLILEGEPNVREKIFRTSVKFFMEYGYEAVSLRQIAREVGIAHNTILHYFGSKEGLASEFNHRCRKLFFEKAYELYQTIPENIRVPEMGLWAYHSILYKLVEGDPSFGQLYYDIRNHSALLMIEGHDDAFFISTMSSLFPGFHYAQLSEQDFRLGLNIVNNCTLVFLYYFLRQKTTIRKILPSYFRVYAHFLLDIQYPDSLITDFYDNFVKDLQVDSQAFVQELLSYKSMY